MKIDYPFDNSTYPRLETFSKRICAGYDHYETKVEVSEGVYEKLTTEWENHPKFKSYFDNANAIFKIFNEELNRELLRSIIAKQ